MPSDINPANWEAWELDGSTRTNTHIWTKSAPVDVTLTTPGTAQDLYAVDPGIPAINLATNPSFETGDPPTGYVAAGSTLARVTTPRTGTYGMRVTPDNAAAGEGFYWASQPLGSPQELQGLYFVVSAYLQDNAGSGNPARLVIADTNGVTLANGTSVALSASWQRSYASLPLYNRAAAAYRVYFVTQTQFATVYYADSFQAELAHQSTPTDYADGSLGVNYEWDGVAHASPSRRRRGIAAVRGYTLHATRDIYLAEDQVASSSTGRFIRAGTDFWEDFPLNVQRRLSFINVNVGEAPRIYGVVRGVHFGRMP